MRRHSICAAPTVKWPASIEGYLELLAAQRASPGGYFRDTDSFARDREWHDNSSAVSGIAPSHVLLNPRSLHTRLPSSSSSVGGGSARSRGSSGGSSADRSAVASATAGPEPLVLADPGQRQRASWEDELDAVAESAQQQGRQASEGPEVAAAALSADSARVLQAAAGTAAGVPAEHKAVIQGGLSPYSVLSPPSSPTTSSSAHASLDENDAAPEVEDDESAAAAAKVSVTTPLLSLEERRARATAEAGLPSEQERAEHSSMRFRGLRSGSGTPTSLVQPSALASTDGSLSSDCGGSSHGGARVPASTRRPSASIRLPLLVPPPASVSASQGPGARMVSLPLAAGARGWDGGRDWDSEWE